MDAKVNGAFDIMKDLLHGLKVDSGERMHELTCLINYVSDVRASLREGIEVSSQFACIMRDHIRCHYYGWKARSQPGVV